MNRIWLVMLFFLFFSSCADANIFDSSAAVAKRNATKAEAIQLVADKFYNGNTRDLFISELSNNKFVVELLHDGGSGLMQIYGAWLIVDGKIIDSLWDEGNFNDSFWGKVKEYK